MQKSSKPDNAPQSEKAAKTTSAPDYRDHNSGRRAAGHGGGDMDRPDAFPDAHREAGYDYSGGGHGHEPGRSLAQEADEDLESRDGPYTRAGRPATPKKPSDQ